MNTDDPPLDNDLGPYYPAYKSQSRIYFGCVVYVTYLEEGSDDHALIEAAFINGTSMDRDEFAKWCTEQQAIEDACNEGERAAQLPVNI